MELWSGKRLEGADIPRDIYDAEDIFKIMVSAVYAGASDVIFQSGRPVLAAIHGELTAITSYWLQPNVMKRLATKLTNLDSIMAKLNHGEDFDTAVPVEDPYKTDEHGNRVKYRFRVNITANDYNGGTGIQIVCRYIPSRPPTVEDIALENEIVASSTPSQGSVLIAGETGSGKTTTFAALLRHILEHDTPIQGNLLTYEAPIEFIFEEISSRHSTVSQQEIGKHIPSFALGIRNSLRRKPSLIVVGELRDAETVLASVEASNTGHPVYSTVHANSAAHIIRRLCNLFPPDQQIQAFHDVVMSSQLLISQLLVPKVGGGRVCLREWQVVDDAIRHELLGSKLEKNVQLMRSILDTEHQSRSMKTTVTQFLKKGSISAQTAERVLYRYGYSQAQIEKIIQREVS